MDGKEAWKRKRRGTEAERWRFVGSSKRIRIRIRITIKI